MHGTRLVDAVPEEVAVADAGSVFRLARIAARKLDRSDTTSARRRRAGAGHGEVNVAMRRWPEHRASAHRRLGHEHGGLRVGSVRATRCGVAGVDRAALAVVTIRRTARVADAATARVAGGAGVPVVARNGVVGEDATRCGVAGVVRADVVVVAHGRRATVAAAATASVVGGAGVPVVARVGVVRKDATRGRVAGVGGADVAVVADGRRTAVAGAAAAGVVGGAGATVIARAGVIGVDATRGRVARVVRAGVEIVAIQSRAGATGGAAVRNFQRVDILTDAGNAGVRADPPPELDRLARSRRGEIDAGHQVSRIPRRDIAPGRAASERVAERARHGAGVTAADEAAARGDDIGERSGSDLDLENARVETARGALEAPAVLEGQRRGSRVDEDRRAVEHLVGGQRTGAVNGECRVRRRIAAGVHGHPNTA